MLSPRTRIAAACLAALAAAAPAAAGVDLEPALSLEAGSPQKLSTNLGVRIAADPETGRGFLFQVQPGLGGGALNVGFVPISFAASGTQALGLGLKARLLRTWGSPAGLQPHRSYAGFEAAVALGPKAAVGVLWRLGSGSGKASVVTWSVGIGL